ncbi:MAG: AMIN domain-containing protein, partial [Acidobacteriota bacterium]
MRLHTLHVKARLAATLLVAAGLALAVGGPLAAGSAPVRLVGVSGQGHQLTVEASEPVAYVVTRPDPLTVVLELRNVSVGAAQSVLDRRDPIAAVSLEQAAPVDGMSLARVRVTLARPYEAAVRSARNTIRLDLTAVSRSLAPPAPLPVTAAPAAMPAPAAAPVARDDQDEAPAATIIDRVRASRTPAATTVTLSGNGRLTPADVIESDDNPRRLVLDFPNVVSKVPPQTHVDGALVTKVRVALNSQKPLITRVVMELGPGATYHVERAGANGGDLAVVFEPPQSAGTILLAAPGAGPVDAEPDIPMDQAIANAASLIPREPVDGPMAALAAAPARR